MNDINYIHKPLSNPLGVDMVCEDLAKEALLIDKVAFSFGSVRREEINGLYKPCYFANDNEGKIYETPIDLSYNRDYSDPIYCFSYPHGAQKIDRENIDECPYFVTQNVSFFVVVDFRKINEGRFFYEELKKVFLKMIKKMPYFVSISILDSPKEVWKDFDIGKNHFEMFPFGALRFNMEAKFSLSE